MYLALEFENEITKVIERFLNQNRLTEENVILREKKENKGDQSKSLQFVEYEYPYDPNKSNQESTSKPILRVEFKTNGIVIHVPLRVFDCLPTFDGMVATRNESTNFAAIKIGELSPQVFDYIEKVMIYSYANYSSSQDSFACCSRYEACSDALHCVHDNQLYAKKCTYRRNLESGRIFYGKNRNIS